MFILQTRYLGNIIIIYPKMIRTVRCGRSVRSQDFPANLTGSPSSAIFRLFTWCQEKLLGIEILEISCSIRTSNVRDDALGSRSGWCSLLLLPRYPKADTTICWFEQQYTPLKRTHMPNICHDTFVQAEQHYPILASSQALGFRAP